MGVYRASLTIAGDAHIARAAHRDTFLYCLTFGQTPIQRGALRHARSGPIPHLRQRAKGRHQLPYRLTSNIFVWPVRKVRRRRRNPDSDRSLTKDSAAIRSHCSKTRRVDRARPSESPQCGRKGCEIRRSKPKFVEGSPTRVLTYPENSHLLPRSPNISVRSERPSQRLPARLGSRKSSPFASRYGCTAPSRCLPETLTFHAIEKKKPMNSVTYPHVKQVWECDIGSRITSPQATAEQADKFALAERPLLNILTQAGFQPRETPPAPP